MFSSMQTFKINGETYEELAKVLQFALDYGEANIKAFYENKNGLVFCQFKTNKAITYPFKPTVPVLVEQTKQYLENLSKEELIHLAGEEPDEDGSVYLGWEVFHPSWYGEDEVENYSIADFLAVRPCWIVYGK